MSQIEKERYVDHLSIAHHRAQVKIIDNAFDRAHQLMRQHPEAEQTPELAIRYLEESLKFFKAKEDTLSEVSYAMDDFINKKKAIK